MDAHEKMDFAKFAVILENAFNEKLNGIYAWAMDILSIVNTISTGIALWVLVKKTPTEMGHYKWFLLNVALSAYAVDIWLTLFTKPLLISMPGNAHGICVLGLMKFLNAEGALFSWLIYTEFLGFFGTSLAFAIIFRYFSMKGKEDVMLSKRALLIKGLIQGIYSVPCIYMAIQCYRDMQQEYVAMDQNEMALWKIIEGHSCIIIDNSQQYISFYLGVIASELIILAIFTILTDHSLRKLRAIISMDTYKYQKQLIFSLLLQVTVPVIFVVGCTLLNGLLVLFHSSQISFISRITFSLSAFHTTANAITMVLGVRQYRKAVGEWLFKFVVIPFRNKIHPITNQTNIVNSD